MSENVLAIYIFIFKTIWNSWTYYSMIVCSQVDMQFVLYIVGLGFTLMIDELHGEMCLVFWFKSSFIQIESLHELLYTLIHMINTQTFRVWIALGKWSSSILRSSVDVISFLQCRVYLRIPRIQWIWIKVWVDSEPTHPLLNEYMEISSCRIIR